MLYSDAAPSFVPLQMYCASLVNEFGILLVQLCHTSDELQIPSKGRSEPADRMHYVEYSYVVGNNLDQVALVYLA